MSAQLKMGMKLAQKLQMTPQLQQSIKLLTLPLMDLEQAVREELLENPVLEEAHEVMEDQSAEELSNTEEQPERHTWMEFTSTYSVKGPRQSQVRSGSGMFNVENVVSTEKSLHDHLTWQIQMSGFSNQEKAYLNLLTDRLDENGYLKTSLAQIASDMKVALPNLKQALKLLHNLDPNGVGARNLKECLLIQARKNQEDTKDLVHLIKNHLPDLENKDFTGIAEQMGLHEEEIMDMYSIIGAMEPKPGARFVTQPVHYITPDVYVIKESSGGYRVSVNEEGLPHLRVAAIYQDMLKGSLARSGVIPMDSTQRYVRHKMNSALWFIRSINQRQRTIFNVTSAIVKRQKDFFDKGPIGMKPMVLRQIAEDLGVHTSTVSRVTTNKYAHTPHGVYELKYFFNPGIETDTGGRVSGEVVKLKILSYIQNEDKNQPVSDQIIMDRLIAELGVHLARRTIAKYRESVNIRSHKIRREATSE